MNREEVRFYTDTHIDKAITTQARLRRINIVRYQDVSMDDANDSEHLEFATRESRTLINADEDFLRLHAEYQLAGRPHAGIIKLQQDRKDNAKIILVKLSNIWNFCIRR